ncbi:TonB-dependent receptor domain-containing protein [Aquimarina sediminis]|uniref:TonB-dependent receptor domain-containing protein n=1 Tax=Aquimarina sediminis TaxID=2070536 RepID=UPI000CA04BE8|nr:TonB-dependent receptor [Aquimarina sediminis]
MKRYIQICFIMFSLSFYAQTGTIIGEVIDNNTQESVPYATIVIKSNNKVITGGITNENGAFLVNKIPLGEYIFEAQFMGYKTISKTISVTESNKKIDLNKVFIEEDGIALDTVEITAERSTIEQKIDRKVINVGKDLTTAGASASDIMRNISNVNVNQDGEISLRGNENVRILIDGKPTNISSSDLLQQIPSTSIKTIELITNPSAKYNPEGMSGIINITLKKNTNLGFNGTINSGVTFGQKERYNNSLSLNHRAGKINIYGSYGNRFGEQITDGTVTRPLELTNQLTKNGNERTSHLVKVGMDYFINDKNTFSIYSNQNVFDTRSDGNKTITFYNNLSSNFKQLDMITKENYNATYNTDYKRFFDEENHSIEFEIDYNILDSDADNDFRFEGNTPVNNYTEIVTDKRSNTTINLDYVAPVDANSILEIGAETRLRRTTNYYTTSRQDFLNSNFSYNRDIYSFYTTFNQSFNKWKYNIGIRLEDYNVNSEFNEMNNNPNNFDDHIFSIYPSGFLKYIPDEEEKNSYLLSFSRRIDRPSLNQINPIRQISTPQIIIVGNPSLNPQFTNSIELNYSRKLNRGTITVGGFYRRIKGEINRIGYFDEDNPTILILDYANFDSNDAYGFEFSSSYRPTNWWNFNTSLDVYSRTQKGVIEGENVKTNNTLLNAKLSNSFKITKKFTFQVTGFYRGPQEILQYELKENAFLNAGARYSFAKGKGTFSLNFNDVFKTQKFAFEAYRTIIQEGEFKRDTHSVYFGLSYRFGGGKNKNLKRKKRDNNEKADKFL